VYRVATWGCRLIVVVWALVECCDKILGLVTILLGLEFYSRSAWLIVMGCRDKIRGCNFVWTCVLPCWLIVVGCCDKIRGCNFVWTCVYHSGAG
jgi:hypothetical protein